MEIKFIELKLQNFKSHRDLTVNFGEETKITADNAKGKSSILEAITWILYSNDIFGSKSDPKPIGYAFDEVLGQLLLDIDGKHVLLGRGLKKNKAQYYINEVPSKATEFNEIVDQMFDKELFMSLFNPHFFSSMHWERQRAMLLQYVTSPANKEVFKQLPEVQADKLKELVKKHSLDDLQKIHKANKTKMEKDHIAAQSKTKTLQEQLNQLKTSDTSLDEVDKEMDEIVAQIAEVEKSIDGANVTNQEYNSKNAELASIQHQIDMSKERWPHLKNEVIEDTCKTCKRPLDDEAVQAVEDDKANRIVDYKVSHKKLTDRKKELIEELSKLEFVDVSEQHEKIRELETKRQPLLEIIRTHKQHEQLLIQIEQAKIDEDNKLTSLKESVFILDAIKDYKAKEAELQGEKVQKLFTTLSTKLFETQKNGEIKPTFEIEYEGRPYRKLSLSESIRAGLELREVLSEQSGIVAPCFIDNSESITKFKAPTGQLIMCKVVAGQELEVVSE